MSSERFFTEAREQSEIKAAIVAKYFWAWAKVIIPWAKRGSNRIAYIDLFAGPGRYEDGTLSTPLMVLERAVQDADMRDMLVAVFNDADEAHARALETAISALPGIERLKHRPQVHSNEVGTEIVAHFERMTLVPTLFFVDPWGYKGLSLRLVNSVLKDWGCDCVFFFNYNRINMGIRNPVVVEHMDALFGAPRAESLRATLELLSAVEREPAIVEAICEALKEMGGDYVLPFRFRRPDGGRTSHHLVFVSKHVRGYEMMKEIMAAESSTAEQGVASFEYNPAARRQGLLFDLARPLDDLGEMLVRRFAGATVTMVQVYERHHVGTRFVKRNYKEVLAVLEAAGRISADPPAQKRRKRKGRVTFADGVRVTFPPPTC